MTRDRAIQIMLAVEMGLVVTEQCGSDGSTFIDKIGDEDITAEFDYLFNRRYIVRCNWWRSDFEPNWRRLLPPFHQDFTQSENEHVNRK